MPILTPTLAFAEADLHLHLDSLSDDGLDNLDFGVVGCRRSIPHLQRLLGHIETALKDLERAVGT